MAKREHAYDGGAGASANAGTEHRPKKKSKTDKTAKTSKEKSTTSSESSKQQTPSITTASATLSQAEIEKFFTDNQIKITDSSPEPTQVCPIVSFDDLPPCSNTEDGADNNDHQHNELYAPLRAFKSPTAIQSATWPLLFAGRDVVGIAETGSGKTLAFGLPCLRRLLLSALKRSKNNSKSSSSPRPSAVMISPTRELAMQIYDQLVQFAKPTPLEVACVFGGVNKDDQRRALRTASIVVATPGRLKDLVGDGSVDLSKVKYLVLDEADRMLDKGFEQDIKDIVSTMPDRKKRQTVMFTATWPPSVRELASTFMNTPVTVTIGGDPSADPRANTRIKQVVEVVDPRDKENRLLQLLNQYQKGKAAADKILVFCLYKKEATRVEKMIRSRGFSVAGIHGDLSQQERFKSLDAFKSGTATILVATDVAARGLDIPAVKLVINVTFPLTVEDYVHRIGRTGRAGAVGHAITLFTETDKALSGGLINVLKAAKQDVPEELLKFGTTVKKKQHDAYGAFFKDVDTSKTATKIKFDD